MKITIAPCYNTRRSDIMPIARRRWKRQVVTLFSPELAPGQSHRITFHVAAAYEQLEDFAVIGTIEGFGQWYTRAARIRERIDAAGALVTEVSLIVVNTLPRWSRIHVQLEWSQDERARQELLS